MTEKIVRRRIVFHGRVQGVGFRATVCALARPLDVVGFVRNLPDGTVEAEIEGTASELEKLLRAIEAEFSNNITNRNDVQLPCQHQETEFTIRR